MTQPDPTGRPGADAPEADALDRLLRAELRRWGIPGAVVGIRAGGETTVRAAGVTSLADPVPVHAETRFRVASITKPLTATVAALLAAAGALELDAPVGVAVPGLRLARPGATAEITLRQLLAHSSGLQCEAPHDLGTHGAGTAALAAAVAALGSLGSLTAPGEIWSYCNTGYWLAGHACALAAGSTYEQAAGDLVLRPLGLAASGFVHDGVPPAGAALGHVASTPGSPGHAVVPGYAFARARVPSGGLVSTVPDLLRLAESHLATASPLAALRLPVADAVGVRWGTGWSLEQIGGITVAAHSGSYGGFQSQLLLVPERGVAVVQLTNSSRGSALIRTVAEWALAETCGLRRPDQPPLEVRLEQFEGSYRADGLTVEVRAAGDRLVGAQHVRLPSGAESAPPPLAGVAVAPTRFAVPDGEARGAQFDFPRPGWVRLGGRLAVRDS